MSEVPLQAVSECDIETGHVRSTLFGIRWKRPLLDTLYIALGWRDRVGRERARERKHARARERESARAREGAHQRQTLMRTHPPPRTTIGP